MTYILNDGNVCPKIGFGTYKTSDVGHVVSKAVDVGYRMFDCAAVYHNEHLIGQAIDDAIKDRKVTRDQLFIISKVWPTSLSRGLPLKSALKSVKDLKCNYLDLLLIHWPLVFAPGEEDFPLDSDGRIRSVDRPLEDIWAEFQEIERSGMRIT